MGVEKDSSAWRVLNSMSGEVPLKEIIDVLEGTGVPEYDTREYIEALEDEGIGESVDTEDGRVLYRMHGDFDPDVVRRDGEYTCSKCGRGLSTGHFLKFDDAEDGPYGPECVKKVGLANF
jgi:hypothetical protein